MRLSLLAAALLSATALAAPQAAAHEYRIGQILIDHPWARPTMTARQPGAAYFVLTNEGETDDRLVAAAPVDFAEAAEIHTHINDDGVMRMRPLADGLVIPAGQTVAFEPGGLHVMMFGLSAPLSEGEAHRLRLTFEQAGEIEVLVNVEQPAAGGEQHQH